MRVISIPAISITGVKMNPGRGMTITAYMDYSQMQEALYSMAEAVPEHKWREMVEKSFEEPGK